ncbi:cartilage matrix protein-like isoform X2 [Littorina saxatilis]|uniref:cartilage matrix protein-like isoform X2 n=1 Tax=Littorina saxatilis TaxID=31220 RepID=UPI0038B43011
MAFQNVSELPKNQQSSSVQQKRSMQFMWILFISLAVINVTSALDEDVENDQTKRTATCTGKADIVFLVDSSGSVGQTNFNKTLQFIKDVVNKFSIGSNDVRIGVDTFSTSFRREFTLGRYSSKWSINSALDRIRYRAGGTDTASALSNMTSGSFSRSSGHRTGVRKVAVVITDGKSNSYSQTAAAARQARSAGIYLVAIGIGSGINVTELNAIASTRRNVFTTPSFSALSGLQGLLRTRLCPVMTPKPAACTGKADIVFLVDSSGSVGQTNFNKTLQFIKDVVNKFSIGSNAVRIGVDTFSSSFRREFTLSRYSSKWSINYALDRISYRGGNTVTASALSNMTSGSFSRSAGHRTGVRKIAVVITDGKSSSYSQTAAAARRARSAGIYLVAIGIGSGINVTELNAIASTRRNVFTTPSFSALSGLQGLLRTRLCPVSCTGRRADVMFLLDSSGSVGELNFNKTLQLVRDVVSHFSIGSNAMKVGVDTFATGFRQEILLRSSSSASSFARNVNKIKYDGGSTYTGLGLTGMTTVSFSTEAGHRTGVPKVGIVVTDGQSSSSSNTVAAAKKAKSAGIYLLVVGVGSSVTTSELNSIATYPYSQNVFNAKSYTSMNSLHGVLAARGCARGSRYGKRLAAEEEIPEEHLE